MKERYLYKAKRIDNGEWVEGALVYDDRDKLYRIITAINYSTGTCLTADNAPRVDSSTICQCTGLQDKNGKLIWENDIVLVKSAYPRVKKGVVEYHAPKYILKMSDYSYNHDLISKEEVNTGREHYYINYKYEVIGNIFDNPELLKSEG